jgi:hypothetical protein
MIECRRRHLWRQGTVEAAYKYQSKGSSWSRKFIVQSVIGSLFLFPMLLTVLNFTGALLSPEFVSVVMYVPRELAHGGLFTLLWEDKTVEYIPIRGFVFMPIHSFMAQIIVGFYFGSSSPRR